MAVVTLNTAEDLYGLPEDFFGELIDGVLIKEPPPTWIHELLVARILGLFDEFTRGGDVIAVGQPGIILRRNPDTVRAPDAALIRRERIPAQGLPSRGYADLIPEVIVEVKSPSTTAAELQAKIHDWLEAGANLVIIVYPEDQSVEAIRSLQDRRHLTAAETLDATDVLPGFFIPLARIFEPPL